MLALESRDSAWLSNQLPVPPSLEPAEGYQVGELVRLGFQDRHGRTERAWLRLTSVSPTGLEGRLLLDLHFIPGVLSGARVAFNRQHVLAHRPPLS